LLEAVENFKDKYIQTAQKVPAAILISALNILNETEINYKAARNKRLHVELALIKLCYLQQAIELSADSSGISKKKIVESAKPVAFRSIPLLQPGKQRSKPADTGEKLIIETPRKAAEPSSANHQPPSIPQPSSITHQPSTTNDQPSSAKLTALSKIRNQYRSNSDPGPDAVNEPLQQEELQQAWNNYMQKLKEAKNPAFQSFEMALLQIKDNDSFEVITSNNIEQKFIEQERNHLFAFLQQQLRNRLLRFTVIVRENTEQQPKPEAPLSSTEQFQEMIKQYPLVKELKDRLKLDLDY
jgi:DNA polymerase-3 subunit gamma/tau